MKKRIVAILLMACLSLSAFAQKTVTLRGRVTDAYGEGVPGAAVMISGTTKGAVADFEGNYVIEVPAGSTLEFSSIGMKTQKVKVDSQSTINIVLEVDAAALQEVVVVGYGTQQRTNLTDAVSTLKGSEFLKAPAGGVNGVIGTRTAGVVALQQSGQPGSDAASLLVRGQSAKLIVDGVERSFNELDPNEIESISILKDATSASVYGLDANTVIIVTTKRGDAQKTRISYSGEYGVSQNTNLIRMLNGPEYAYWYNKTLELDAEAGNSTAQPIFTAQIVEDMKNGANGWGNTDWYAKTFGTGTTQHHNVSATGGNERTKYFASIGAYDQNGNVRNFNFKRYNLRSNVDSQINDNLKFSIDLAGRIEERSQPGFSANPDDWSNIPQQAVRTLPFLPETYTIDGVEYPVSGRTNSSWVNPLAAAEKSGYYTSRNTYIQSNVSLSYDVPFIKGLNLKFMGSYDTMFQTTKSLATPYYTAVVVLPTAGTEELKYTKSTDARGTTTSVSESASYNYILTTQTSASYDRTFGNHTVSALAVAETRENVSHTMSATGYGLDFVTLAELGKVTNKTGDGSEKQPVIGGFSGNSRIAGFVGRLNYSYADRYLLQLSCRRDGSYVFSNKAGARWVTLPGVSLGWKVNNENWFKASWVDLLKLRASVGMTANSNVSAYQYLNLMNLTKNAVVIGQAPASMVYASTLENPDLTWSKAINYNVGLDFEAWHGLLGLEIDAFYKYEYDILSSVTGSWAPSLGGYYPSYGNENKKDYRGVDLTIRHNNYIGDFSYGVKFITSYAYRRWLYYAGDSETAPEWQRVTGTEVGSQIGFISLGLFKDQEEVDNSATIPGSNVAPGYIKYLDRNGDGVITYAQDRGYVAGSAYPRIQGSLNLFASWKGFDLDMLWQGATGRTVALTGVYTATGSSGIMDNTFLTKAFYHGGNSPLFLLENSWTHENPDGEFPRPSITPLSSNNAYSSTFWYRDGSYLRLKSLQLGYTIPANLTQKAGISQFRVYLQGSNLLTFSGLTKYNIDPEQPGVNNGYYPQQKTYQLGVKVTF